jgi:hypothetical protein
VVKVGRKILPVAEPFVGVYPKHAIPFSILTGRGSFEQWLSCNYIQLRCSKTYLEYTPVDFLDFFTVYPEFYENPCLHSERLSITTIANWESNAVDFFTGCIDMGFYIYTHVDEQYVPESIAYQKRSLPHAILIYGYDKENRTMDFGGFSTTGAFTFRRTGFDIIEKAFNGLVDYPSPVNNLHENYYAFTYLLKPKETSDYAFDFHWMLDSLRDYADSRNTSGRFRGYANSADDHYGIVVYDKLKHFYERIPDETRSLDVRPLHLLWEHKKCMLARLDFLAKGSCLSRDPSNEAHRAYVEIEELSRANRNLLIKYAISKKSSLLERLIDNLSVMKEKETDTLQKLICDLGG